MTMLLYIAVVGVFGYVMVLSGLLQENAMPYYVAGLTIYAIIQQSHVVYLSFSTWRAEILAKPVSPDAFLLGSYFGSLLTTSLPMLILFFVVLPFYWAELNIQPFFLILSFIFGILCSIAVSYFFASLGLMLQPEGQIASNAMLLFTFLCGVAIPVYIIPKPLIYFSYAIPFTWAIDLFRASILSINPILPPFAELTLLIILTVLYFVFGKIALEFTIRAVRKRKVIVR